MESTIEIILTVEGDGKRERKFAAIKSFYNSINNMFNGLKYFIKALPGKTFTSLDIENQVVLEHFSKLYESNKLTSHLTTLYFTTSVQDIIKRLETMQVFQSVPKEEVIKLVDSIHEIKYNISECLLFESLQRSFSVEDIFNIIDNLFKVNDEDYTFMMKPSLINVITSILYAVDPFMNPNEIDRVGYLNPVELMHPLFGSESRHYVEGMLNKMDHYCSNKLSNPIHFGIMGLFKLNFALILSKISPFLSELNIAANESQTSFLKFIIHDECEYEIMAAWALQTGSVLKFINSILLGPNGIENVKNSEPSTIKLHLIISDLIARFPLIIRNLPVERMNSESAVIHECEDESEKGDSLSCLINAIQLLYGQFASPLHARLSLEYWWPESSDFNDQKTANPDVKFSKKNCSTTALKDLYKSKSERDGLKQTALLRFLRQTGEIASVHRSLFKSYLEMLRSLVNCSAAAELCFQQLCSTPSHSTSILSWDHFIDAMMKYYDQYNNSNANPNENLHQMDPAECEALEAVVKLIRRICNLSLKLSLLLCEDGNLQLIQLSFGLLTCPISPQLKSEYLLLLAAFARQSPDVLGTRIWKNLIKNDFININQNKGGLIIEIDEVEPKNGLYPITISFLTLITSLVPVICESQEDLSNKKLEYHEDVKTNLFNFIVENIFLRHNMRLFNKPYEKDIISSQCLFLFHHLLDIFIQRLTLVMSIEDRVLNEVNSLPPDWPYSDPGYFIAQQILSGSYLFKIIIGYMDYHLKILKTSIGCLNRETQSISWLSSMRVDPSNVSYDFSTSFVLIANSISLILGLLLRIAENENNIMTLIRGELSFNVPSWKNSDSFESQVFLNHCKARSSAPVVSLSKLIVSINLKNNSMGDIGCMNEGNSNDFMNSSSLFLYTLLKYVKLQDHFPEVSLLSLDLFIWIVNNYSPHNQLLSQLFTSKSVSERILSIFVEAFENEIIVKVAKSKPYILGDSAWLLNEMPTVPSLLPSCANSLFENPQPSFDQIRSYHHLTMINNCLITNSFDEWENLLSLGCISNSFLSDSSSCSNIICEDTDETLVSSRGKILSFILGCYQKFASSRGPSAVCFSHFLLGFDVSSSANLSRTELQDVGVGGNPKNILHCCLEMINKNYIPISQLCEIILPCIVDERLTDQGKLLISSIWHEVLVWSVLSTFSQNFKSTGSNLLRYLRNNFNLLHSQLGIGQLLQDFTKFDHSGIQMTVLQYNLELLINSFIQIKQCTLLKTLSYDIYDALSSNQRQYVLKIVTCFLNSSEMEAPADNCNFKSLLQSQITEDNQFSNRDNLSVILFEKVFENLINFSIYVNSFLKDVYQSIDSNDEILNQIMFLNEKISKSQELQMYAFAHDGQSSNQDSSSTTSIVAIEKFRQTIDYLLKKLKRFKSVPFETGNSVIYQSFTNTKNFILNYCIKSSIINITDFLQVLIYASEKLSYLMDNSTSIQSSFFRHQNTSIFPMFNSTNSPANNCADSSSLSNPFVNTLISLFNQIIQLVKKTTVQMDATIQEISLPPCPIETKRFLLKTFEDSLFYVSSIFPYLLILVEEKINSNCRGVQGKAIDGDGVNKTAMQTNDSFFFNNNNSTKTYESGFSDSNDKFLYELFKNIISTIESFNDISVRSTTNFYATIINFLSVFENTYFHNFSVKEVEKNKIICHALFQKSDETLPSLKKDWYLTLSRDIISGQHRVTRMVSSSLMTLLIFNHERYLKGSKRTNETCLISPIDFALKNNVIEHVIGQVLADMKSFIELQNELDQLSNSLPEMDLENRFQTIHQQQKVRLCEFLFRIQFLLQIASTRKGSETIVQYELIKTMKDRYLGRILKVCFENLLLDLSNIQENMDVIDSKSIQVWLRGLLLNQCHLDELQRAPVLLLVLTKIFQLIFTLVNSLGSKHHTLYVQIQALIRDVSEIIFIEDNEEKDSSESGNNFSTATLLLNSILMRILKTNLRNLYENRILICYLEFSSYFSSILQLLSSYVPIKNQIDSAQEDNDIELINHCLIQEKIRVHTFAQLRTFKSILNALDNIKINEQASDCGYILYERLRLVRYILDVSFINATTISTCGKFIDQERSCLTSDWLFSNSSFKENRPQNTSSLYKNFSAIKNKTKEEGDAKTATNFSQKISDFIRIIELTLKFTLKSKETLQAILKFLNNQSSYNNKQIDDLSSLFETKNFNLTKWFLNNEQLKKSASTSSEMHQLFNYANQVINITLTPVSVHTHSLLPNASIKKNTNLFETEFQQSSTGMQPTDSVFKSSDEDCQLNEVHYSKLASTIIDNHCSIFLNGLSSVNQFLWILIQQTTAWLSSFNSTHNNGRFISMNVGRGNSNNSEERKRLDDLIGLFNEQFIDLIHKLCHQQQSAKGIPNSVSEEATNKKADTYLAKNEKFLNVMVCSLKNLMRDLENIKKEYRSSKIPS